MARRLSRSRFESIHVGAAKGALTRSRNQAIKSQWYIENVAGGIEMTLHQRVKLATRHLQLKVKSNLSVSVQRDRYTGKLVRSKEGEFPRADTLKLHKTITNTVSRGKGWSEGRVGTPLPYGVKLELHMHRSFLVRTLNEERPILIKLLSGPIRSLKTSR